MSAAGSYAAELIAGLVDGCLIEVDLRSGYVHDPAQRLSEFLGDLIDRNGRHHSARWLLRQLHSPTIVLGALKAARLLSEQTHKVVLRFGDPQEPRHLTLYLRAAGDDRFVVHLLEFTKQRQQDIFRTVLQTALNEGTAELVVLDSKMRIIHCNRALLANIGYEQEELIGKPASIVARDLADPAFLKEQQQAYIQRHATAHTYKHRRKDGSEYVFDYTATQVRMFGQHWYVAIGQDITESIQQQEALRESEERLTNAVSSGRVAILDYQPQEETFYISHIAWSWLGLEAPETGTPISEEVERWTSSIHPDDRSRAFDAFLTPIARRFPVDIELRSRHCLGYYVWLEIHAQVERNDDGIHRISGTVSNVSAQREAEEARNRVTKNLQAVLSSVNEAILTLDATGQLIEWNQAAEALTPQNLKEVGSVFELFEDPLPLAAQPQNVPVRTQLSQRETEDSGHVEVYINAIELDPDPGFTIVIHDISTRIAEENALRAAAESAAAAARSKSEFLATMSHEIRTPMNGVLGMAQILMDTPLDEQQRDALRIMVESGTALLDIINDVLDMSRLEAGKLDFEHQPFDLNAMLHDIGQLLSPQAKAKSIDLSVRPLPNDQTSRLGDAGRVRQIVLNLLGNAIKFTKEGGVSVGAELRDGGKRIEFEVRDSGIGISEDSRERLFVPFSQVDSSTTRRFGGTGLGLAISHELVLQMGGKIWVDSEIGVGSTFRFDLPLPKAPSRSQRAANDDPRVGNDRALTGSRVLVVED
ncbi:MAG: ATP-binding protein, partial [Pseudomonadota bacterium]